jgi:benzoate/toluate 1,2-dioxygenase subunit alpha
VLAVRHHVSEYVDDRPGDRAFRVDPSAFVDPELFELELEAIFERTWIFLTLESELRAPHDYVTSRIGRTPVLVTRDRGGELRAFLNLCRHKGAVLCSREAGNSPVHVCPYHHWSYNASGRHLAMKDKAEAHYPPSFERDELDLVPVRLESYRGLIFGTLCKDVPPLEQFLGDVRVFIDLIMDQGARAMELIPGRAPYTFNANWKLQQDNGLDPYHVTSTHMSLLDLQKRRDREAAGPTVRGRDWQKHQAVQYHNFTFPYGHAVLFTEPSEPEKRPIYPSLAEIRARVGEAQAANMLYGVQIHLFPSLQLASEMACILRKIHPLEVGLTEMEVRCLGVIGESAQQRALRLRQFEDFFNASGMASPDDSIIYESCQRGAARAGLQWLKGYSRGAGAVESGANTEARRLGITPTSSLSVPARTCAETNLHSPYREWRRMLEAALAGRKAYD